MDRLLVIALFSISIRLADTHIHIFEENISMIVVLHDDIQTCYLNRSL